MITRREFIKLCLSSAALTLSGVLLPKVAEALDEKGEKVTIIWLEMMTCTGDFLSFANTLNPDLEQLIKNTIKLEYQNTLMAAEGELALKHLYEIATREEGAFILVAEGTVPIRNNGFYGNIGFYEDGTSLTDLDAIKFLGQRARHVIAIGSCASFGGPYAAKPNPSGSVPVHEILKGVQVINVPGCPVHPDWFVGTLSHVILYGVPTLDAFGRPLMFFRHSIHDFCPRRQYFENGNFAKNPGDEECLFQIGCKGPVTYSDCPTRMWNSMHLNWPVGANTPCIGCASPEFPDKMSPFFAHLQDVKLPNINVNASLVGKAAIGTAAAAIGTHAIISASKGRIFKHLVESSETKDLGKELEKVIQDKLNENEASNENIKDVEADSSRSDNSSIAGPTDENVGKEGHKFSQKLSLPTRQKIKKPKKLVARKLRR